MTLSVKEIMENSKHQEEYWLRKTPGIKFGGRRQNFIYFFPFINIIAIGTRAPSDLGGGGVAVVKILARKNYTMPERASVEIGIQTYLDCGKNKNVHSSQV